MSRREGSGVYRALLRLLPPGIRRERGREMERLFEDMRREWVSERGGAGLGFWVPLVADTVKDAAVEWLAVCSDVIRSATALTMGEHMSALWGDVRFALRQLIRQPGYALTVLVLMTVGIAGNAAVFRVVNGLFIRPLPFDAPEQLVDLDETAPAWDLDFTGIAFRDFDRWRSENGTFQSMTVIDRGGGNAVIDGEAQRVSYLLATHDIDDVLRIQPFMGRFFGTEEDHPEGTRVALLTYGFWQQQFAADPDILGKTVQVNGFQAEIIGVLPETAAFLGEVDLWMPLRGDAADFSGWSLNGIGRLKPDGTIEQARDDLMGVHKAMIDDFEVNEITSPVIHSLRERYLGDYRLGSGFLMGAVGIVLLIACANIAGLMFARSLARGPEISVRLALGAPRGRIIRQLLTESFVLAGIGAAAGLALGIWGSNLLVVPMADQFPRWVVFDLDGRFLAFTAGLTTLAALLFGLAPAMQASAGAGPSTGVRSTRGRSSRRAMSVLVSGEVALAVMLLIVSGLSVLDVQRLGQVDPGFEAEGLLAYSVALPALRYPEDEDRLAFQQAYLERLQALPGVDRAAITSGLPLSGHWGWFFVVDGAPPRGENESNPVVLNRIVSPGYFETAGVEFVAGRAFDDFDGRERDDRAIIVNESFVRSHLSHLEDPLGAQVVSGTDIGDDPTWMTVVGVTRDVKHYGVDEDMRPGVYQPLRQLPLSSFQVALRGRGDNAGIVSAVRGLTTELDSELPIFQIQAMTDELDESLWTRRAMSWLIAAFSTVALVLAMAGIYGVISYSVGQRTQEISIRMAIGAQREDVLNQVVKQGMLLVGMGIVAGLGIALAGARLVSGMLVGVDATDPRVYLSVTVVLGLVAGLANYLPARRAAALNPMRALRGE